MDVRKSSFDQITADPVLTGDFIFYIDGGVEKEKLIQIDYLLSKIDAYKVVIVVDNRHKSTGNIIHNLDIIKFIPHVKKLTLLSNSSVRLEDLSELSRINNLTHLDISGFLKKNISLKPIEKFTALISFELENGLSKNQHLFVDKLACIEHLRVNKIDISLISPKDKLVKLHVNNTIHGEALLADHFPALKHLKLVYCKNINDFSFLNNLKNLESLSICYTKNLKAIPIIESSINIKNLELLSVGNLSDIKGLFHYKNLENLSITGLKNLCAKDFYELAKLQNLKYVYINFIDLNENKLFESFRKNKGWINKNNAWKSGWG